MKGITAFIFSISLLTCNISFAQQSTVKGLVSDSITGETLPGVNVIVKETSTGTATNGEGEYQLEVSSLQDTLVFSFVGYQTQQVPINGQTEINVQLAPGTLAGEEVVVIGYGQQEKRDVTASITSVSEREISEVPVVSTTEALQGRVSGVDIQQTGSGQPGEDPQITIRGRRSITASNDPLFVVDGIPFEGNINDINTQNIESLEVLKDAAATAIYGSRGANGVILITTKRGASGGMNISYDGYYGVSQAQRIPDMMNGQEYANLSRESGRRIINDGNQLFSWNGELPSDEEIFSEVELNSLEQEYSSDWVNMVLSRGHQQNHQISLSGGNESTRFLVSGNYLDEKSIVKTNGYTRFSLRVNLDHSFSDNFRIGTSMLANRSKQDWDANPMYEAFWNNPLGPAFDDERNLIFFPTADGLRSNPLANLQPGVIEDDRNFTRVFASIYAELDILENLTYRLNFGPDYKYQKRGEFLGSMTNQRRGATPTAERANEETFTYTLENVLSYSESFYQNHNLDVTLLQSIQNFRYGEDFMNVRGLPFESQKYYNIGSAQEILGVSSDLEEWQLTSFMGRFRYDYKSKYLLQMSGRADGSSRLSQGNKWAFFPGVSVGWRIIEEPFMEPVDFLSDLKLRASYGVVGNTSIAPYQTKGRLTRTAYNYGETPGYGYQLNELANPELGWEKTATVDVGIDYELMSGRISGSIDYYRSRTTDLLLSRQLPTTSGYFSILQNVGETRNTGIEVGLSTVNITSKGKGGFRWTTDLNWSANNEEIINLFNEKQDDIGNEWFIGEPINVFYDYEKTGIWQQDEQEEARNFNQVPGQIKIKDQNGDGSIDGSDRVILGSDVPNWIGGMTNRFFYKGFDLSVVVFARIGNMIESEFRQMTELGRFNTLDVNFWTADNPTNDFPRPDQSFEQPLYGSAMSYFDASYIKIRNVNLGYTLPNSLLANLGFSTIRIYANIKNAAIISDYTFADPEQADGIVGFDIPSTRLYSFGINIGL